jgi:hypothetical protein
MVVRSIFDTVRRIPLLRRVRIVLWLLAAAWILHAVLGDKPWELGIQERMARELSPKLSQFISEGLWYASVANALLALGLLATSRWWLDACSGVDRETQGRSVTFRGWGRSFWLLLCVAMGFALVERLPRMSQSFANDEEYAFRRLIFADLEVEPDGDLEVDRHSWRHTLFENRASNNHVVFTVLARLSHEVFRLILGASAPFHEWTVRLPSLLAGVLSVGAIGVMLALAGARSAGMAAAFVMALNPWHLRYATEARGYSVLLLLLLLSTIALMVALKSGSFRAWLMFSIAQALSLLTFPAAIYVIAMMQLAAVPSLMSQRRDGPWFRVQGMRWLVSNVVSAMLFLQFFAPSFRQLHIFLQDRAARSDLGMKWMIDVWSHLVAGMRWYPDDMENAMYLSIQHSFEMHPWTRPFFLIIVPLLVLAGCFLSIRRGRGMPLLVIPTIGAALLAFLHMRFAGKMLYGWYVIYSLIGFSAAIGLALEWVASIVRRAPRVSFALVSGLFLFGYWFATEYPRNMQQRHARQPMREAVERARGSHFHAYTADGAAILTASVGTSAKQLGSYDPRVVPLTEEDNENVRVLQELISASRRSGKPLRVLLADEPRVRDDSPETLRLLKDPRKFRKIAKLHGLERMFTYHVYDLNLAKPLHTE